MEFSVGKVVVADQEVFARGNSEGQSPSRAGVIPALGDGGENFGPCGRVGFESWLQEFGGSRLPILSRILESPGWDLRDVPRQHGLAAFRGALSPLWSFAHTWPWTDL